MDFNEAEATEGSRWVWHVAPTSKLDAARMVVPLAIVHNVIMKSPEIPVLEYGAVRCNQCTAVLNPFCSADYMNKMWTCPFCLQRNYFPSHYSGVNEHNLPAELHSTFSIVEYEPKTQPGSQMYGQAAPGYTNVTSTTSPGFLFVVDTCMSFEDLEALKVQLTHLLTILPEDARVGLVSFGTMVSVHVLGLEFSKQICFPGNKDLSPQRIQELLGVSSQKGRPNQMVQQAANQYILPASECEFSINEAIEELQPNGFENTPGHRPRRATGAALAVAAALMEGCLRNVGSRIMLFVSGPATHGPGLVVETETDKMIRSHQNIVNGTAPHYKKACDFYDEIGRRLVENSHALDLFACSLDQVGAAELKTAVQSTGGLMVLAETFESEQFKRSLNKMFSRDEQGHLLMGFNATFEVITSMGIKLNGAIGPCSAMKKREKSKAGSNVSDTEVGIGGTNVWKLCTLDHKTAVTVFFEVAHKTENSGSPFFIQFLTQYQHGNGNTRMRVTTISRRWIDATDQDEMVKVAFDQETAAAVMAKLASHKAENEETFDIVRWVDKQLIRVSSRFGEYVKEDPSSFRFSPSFSLYPQFIYHLRRSQFLVVFNNSPDETAFFRLMLNRENVVNSMVMIQPTLMAYSADGGPPVPVLLDISSITPDVVLLFDSFFFVVVHYGSMVAFWRREGYHKDEQYANVRALLETPIADALMYMRDRVPEPKLIECDQHGSQARWLLAKLNPSSSYNTTEAYGEKEVIFTDDVSLELFIDHLKRLAVQQAVQ